VADHRQFSIITNPHILSVFTELIVARKHPSLALFQLQFSYSYSLALNAESASIKSMIFLFLPEMQRDVWFIQFPNTIKRDKPVILHHRAKTYPHLFLF